MVKRGKYLRKLVSVVLVFTLLVLIAEPVGSLAASKKKPTFSKKTLRLKVGKKKTLKITGVSKNRISKKKFKSSKKKVAKVSASGRITAKKQGTATITCKLTLKDGKKYTLKCKVIVKKKSSAGNNDEDSEETNPGGTSTNTPVTNPPISTDPGKVTTAPPTSTDPGEVTTAPPTSTDPGEVTTAPPTSADPGEMTTAPPTSTDSGEVTTAPPTSTDSGEVTTAPPTSTESGEVTTAPPTSTESGEVTTAPPTSTESGEVTTAPPTSTNPGEVTTAPPETQETDSPEPSQRPESPKVTIRPDQEHASKNGIMTRDDGEMRSDVTAFDIVHEMGLGINLGNTMEAWGPWLGNSAPATDYEKAWGQPITTQEMITGMKASGFQSIRIPVAWSNMVSADYTINEAYFDRVETIMNYALNVGMYVIVNIHWDGGWWGQFGSADGTVREKAWKRYEAFWTQIAQRYQDYSDYLIFESANEELGDRLNDDLDANGNPWNDGSSGTPIHGVLTLKERYQMIHDINQKFVDIVRGTGGNNRTRYLLLAGYDTDIDMTCNSAYQMPQDTIEDHLMVSVHYYSPADYCLAEEKDNSWGYKGSWGTASDMAEMRSQLGKMKTTFTNRGIPVVIGEYGVCDTKLSENNFQRKEGRDLFFRTLCEYALDSGMVPMLWDTNAVYSRSQCKIVNEKEAADYLELAEGIQDRPVFAPEGKRSSYIWNGTIGCDNWNPVAPVAKGDVDFILSSVGGCYSLSGVDWDNFEHPVLTLHTESGSGSVEYQFATEVNEENIYYKYIEKSKLSGTWSFANDKVIDLSSIGLTGMQTLYLSLKTKEFKQDIQITISEK